VLIAAQAEVAVARRQHGLGNVHGADLGLVWLQGRGGGGVQKWG
jgi:hypothetical protein